MKKESKQQPNCSSDNIGYKDCVDELREWLVFWTGGCDIQGGFPCGTCVCGLLDELGVNEDKQHNKPIDRINEVWRAILQIREPYVKSDLS
jgi:hypothetical protein